MRKIILTIGILALLTGGTAYAAYNWSDWVQVADIEVSDVGSGGGVWLSFTPEPFPSHTCPNKSGQYRLGGSVDNIKQITTLAVSGMLHARPARVFWFGGCDTGNYPILLGLQLR